MNEELSVICWKWKSDPVARYQYTAADVNKLYAMFARNYSLPFKFFCVTDETAGIRSEVQTYPSWTEPNVTLSNARKPNCYRRLKIFTTWAAKEFGPRILSIDLDCVILSDITLLFDEDVNFKAWNMQGVPYQGGLVLHRPGTMTEVWDKFNPISSPRRAAGYIGSDQAWMSYIIPAGRPVWTPRKDHVYSYKAHIRKYPELIEKARIVFFHGVPKPHDVDAKWIKQHWRE